MKRLCCSIHARRAGGKLQDMIEANSKQRRWRPQFRLRTLMIAVSVFGLLFGVVLLRRRLRVAEYHRQQDAASFIEKHGGGVYWSRKPSPSLNWFGDSNSICQQVISVNCDERTDMPAILNAVGQLPDCDSITLWPENLTKETVNLLVKMKQIQKIEVRSYGGTDTGQLRNLLVGKIVTDAIFSRYGSF